MPSTKIGWWRITLAVVLLTGRVASAQNPVVEVSAEEMKHIRAAEQTRVAAIDAVYGTVLSILGENGRGAGSGVIFDASGLALTNHHVVAVVGKKGKAGLSDGNVYPWTLIGTDPGGDIAIIQLTGRDKWPAAELGDSKSVRAGDWVMAMGNPFGLAEDHSPTVTLGIVSGVERYQGGGMVYGNCIQVDCAINPGNSGGPLFNMRGEIIGINGRAAFAERGRVNVGVGFAVSANQIANFVPDLLATKVAQHGTLDAQFGMREGRVICESINLDSRAARAGLELGDELLSINGIEISTANELANFLATLPNEWPVHLSFAREGKVRKLSVRLSPLTYVVQAQPQSDGDPSPPQEQEPESEPNEDSGQEQDSDSNKDAKKKRKRPGLPPLKPGQLLSVETNQANATKLLEAWQATVDTETGHGPVAYEWTDQVRSSQKGESVAQSCVTNDGRFSYSHENLTILRNSAGFFLQEGNADAEPITMEEALSHPGVLAVATIALQHERNLQALLGQPALDGGDFVNDQLAYRLRFDQTTEEPFFLWVSAEQPETLLKAGFDEDGTTSRPAVTFHHLSQSDGQPSIHHRRQIIGVRSKVVTGWMGSDVRIGEVPERLRNDNASD